MISLEDAFKKFKSRLELNEREQKDASRLQKDVRQHMDAGFSIANDFLTGSYKRHTKTKPLKDVDIFTVLDKEKESKYINDPTGLLAAVTKHLKKEYGDNNVSANRRSVEITFGTATDTDAEDEKVFSIDVVPAFVKADHYIILDPKTSDGWTHTNPKIHEEKATKANEAFGGQWKPLVKMIKKWNEHHGNPIKPSFLIEVMALEILNPPFSGGYEYELKAFFATARDKIHLTWNDPAGLGPAVSDQMDAERIANAKEALKNAELNVSKAIQLQKQGKNGESLKVWREKIFGPKFPLS